MEISEYLLEMNDIVKEFPGVRALNGVQLKIKKGEIHALVGENGAGKSTICKCLMGIYKPTSGQIIYDGQERSHYSIKEAIDLGISMIHQELSPVLYRSVMSNFFIGREPTRKNGLIDWRNMHRSTKEWLEKVGLDIDPNTQMSNLTVAEMQMVEIAKAISYNAKLIIMDEPTAALTNTEISRLFEIMRRLKSEGNSILYISHRLDEIYQITDRISVFRDGSFIGCEDTDKLPLHKMISMMVGREVADMFPKIQCDIGDVQLKIKNLSHQKHFKNVSFDVKKGEIFGIAGLVGAGRTEVLETIFGIRSKSEGEVILNGERIHIKNSNDAIAKGLALVTEERRKNGIFPMLSIQFNASIANMNQYIKNTKLINHKRIKQDVLAYIKKIDIKTPSVDTLIQDLSGGNQQKVLIARWFLTDPKVMFLDEPTRGIDVGAKAEIHKLLSQFVGMGRSVVMVSSELIEIMGMSDRIMTMHEGHVTGILDNNKHVTQEILMEYISGIRDDFPEKIQPRAS
jgi:methyl-galactoside transport system ATP-binding protein/inositol transport system ATP-binding protein